ncbi:MAG TPA: FtsX-like permease family protein, partial [Gemmatimonadales bacterium]|nr:FtsX-like permease family protein [Gemmatimonadales bacterium]
AEPASTRAAREIAAIPGVLRAEGERSAAVRVSAGHRYRDVPLIGREEGAELRRVVDKLGIATAVRAEGICLTAELGRILGVGLGDSVDVRMLQGERRRTRLQVSAFSEELFGLQAYMPLAAMNRFLGEGPSVNAVHLRVDPRHDPAIRARLGTWPRIATVTSREAERAHIERQTASYQRVTMLVITLAAVAITIGVVYNNARIALSLRSRELASLRVLGFTRAEISRMLLGEIAFEVLLSLAPGVLAGWALTWLVTAPVETERFRWPVVMTAETCAFAAGLVLAAATASALLVRRRLDRLDLIAVLKSRE